MIGLEVAAKAEEWIGVPFRWQGAVRAGCDCKGLCAGVARELGRAEAVSVEALAGDYGGKVDARRLKAGLARLFDQVTARQPGDLLLLKLSGQAQHLAICAPLPGKPSRVIEAMCRGPMKVRPSRWPDSAVDSIWRWRSDCP